MEEPCQERRQAVRKLQLSLRVNQPTGCLHTHGYESGQARCRIEFNRTACELGGSGIVGG